MVERFRHRHVLHILTASLQTANIAYLQRNIQLSKFSAYLVGTFNPLNAKFGLVWFISIDPYRITHPLDMENGYNNTKCTNIYNIQCVSAI